MQDGAGVTVSGGVEGWEREGRTLLVSSKIVRRELDVSNGELLRGCDEQRDPVVSNSSTSSRNEYALGCRVGWRVASLSFLSMWRSV